MALNTLIKKFVNGIGGNSTDLKSSIQGQFGVAKPATSNMSVAPVATTSTTPKNNFISSTAGATSTKPTTITPLPQSGQQYVSSIANQQPAYNTTTGLLTDYGKTQGLPEVNASKTIQSSPSVSSGTPKKESAYIEYLKSMFNPEQLKIASDNTQALNERTSRELERSRDREDELRKNEVGQLKTGQDYQLGENERLSNKSLADLAIAKGANTDIYNQMLNAGKSVYEAEQAQAQADADAQTNLPASAQEYEYAKKSGYSGTFQEYQTEDANRKAQATGLTPAQINTTVNSIAGAFDNEPTVKEYNSVQSTISALQNAGQSPTDDIQRIYAFAKVMDPTSVVREGEYKTVQDYSTALLQRMGINVARAFDARGFLTDEARNNMLTTLNNVLQAKKSAYDNVAAQYQRQIDDAYAGKNRTITNYSGTGSSTGSGQSSNSFAEVW